MGDRGGAGSEAAMAEEESTSIIDLKWPWEEDSKSSTNYF
jgi:hypothetical protein